MNDINIMLMKRKQQREAAEERSQKIRRLKYEREAARLKDGDEANGPKKVESRYERFYTQLFSAQGNREEDAKEENKRKGWQKLPGVGKKEVAEEKWASKTPGNTPAPDYHHPKVFRGKLAKGGEGRSAETDPKAGEHRTHKRIEKEGKDKKGRKERRTTFMGQPKMNKFIQNITQKLIKNK